MGYNIYRITFLFTQNDLKQWFVVFFITVEWVFCIYRSNWSSFSSENPKFVPLSFQALFEGLCVIMLIAYKRETGNVKSRNSEWGFEKN